MTDPNELYKDTLKRLNITADELGYLMQEYIKEYTVEVSHTPEFELNISQDQLEDHIKTKLIDQVTKDIIENKIFPSNIKREFIPYNDTWKTSLRFEAFDFDKFNRVFRPERLI